MADSRAKEAHKSKWSKTISGEKLIRCIPKDNRAGRNSVVQGANHA